MSADNNTDALLLMTSAEMQATPVTTNVGTNYNTRSYQSTYHNESPSHHLWCFVMCAMKGLTTFLVYLTFVLMLVAIINVLLGDIFYNTGDLLDTCKSGWAKWADNVNEDIVLNNNHHNIEMLKKMNFMVLSMLNSGSMPAMPNPDGTMSTPKHIDFSSPNTLQTIINIEEDFDVVLFSLNKENRDTDDMYVLRQLDYANLVVAKSFRNAADLFKKKVLDSIKNKNAATTSGFTSDPQLKNLKTSVDVNYAMAASGINQSDIADQQHYLSNPDNVAAFSSAMVQSEISNVTDHYTYSVKPYGLRQVKEYASPWSGPGFGVQEPSEVRVTNSADLPKTSYNL